MSDRDHLAHAFLHSAGWSAARSSHLAGDASNRRYERLTGPEGQRAVLMDAPPETGENVGRFVEIAGVLRSQNLSAPEIFAQDTKNGFLLLEDLGDALFARVVDTHPEQELALYTLATDVLVCLQQAPCPESLAPYGPKSLAEMTDPVWHWYQRDTGGNPEKTARDFAARFETVLAENLGEPDVLIQRDYHAENLLWLPDRSGVARVGILDFQDAMIGHRAYDLVSLLQDARRDVSEDVQEHMIAHYVAKTQQNADDFRAAYHLIGLQRNLRILGIFARLSLHFGKPHYVDLIPRVWRYVQHNLDHEVASDLRDVINQRLPRPTPDFLQKLRDQCGTVPTP